MSHCYFVFVKISGKFFVNVALFLPLIVILDLKCDDILNFVAKNDINQNQKNHNLNLSRGFLVISITP